VDLVLTLGMHGGRIARSALAPAGRLALRAPLPRAVRPGVLVREPARRGAERRSSLQLQLSALLDRVVPMVADSLLRRIALTQVILTHVDLDHVVAAVDVDAVARRLDVDAVVSRVDLDAAVQRVDADAVVSRIDLDAAAERVDIDRVLDQVDLTDVVLRRVDLDALVAAVLAKIDLVALAQEVIEAVDLPALVRESTGTMASDSIRGARLHAIAADDTLSRTVGRLLSRRGGVPPPTSHASGQELPLSPG
jgi:hypothetical protein